MDEILAWSEVWATLLPILVWIVRRPQQTVLQPVKIYLVVALVIYVLIDSAYSYIKLFESNYVLYNINAVIRVLLFAWFFLLNGIPKSQQQFWLIFGLIITALTINFLKINIYKSLSSTYTIEALILIGYSIVYFIARLKAETISTSFDPALVIVTGLSIYEASCFFIFLYYDTLSESFLDFAVDIWQVHNIFYIVFCLYIARAFYGRFKYAQRQ